jgi:hypothetical protein
LTSISSLKNIELSNEGQLNDSRIGVKIARQRDRIHFGEPCCEPVVYPDVEREQAERMAAVAKTLGDPIRLQLVGRAAKARGQGLRL